jgi:GTP-binding protein
MQISQLDYNNYVGVIGIGRIKRGKVKPNQQVTIIDSEGKTRNGKVGKVLTHLGLERIESDVAEAGDIIAITGLGELNISDTICDPQNVEALPACPLMNQPYPCSSTSTPLRSVVKKVSSLPLVRSLTA